MDNNTQMDCYTKQHSARYLSKVVLLSLCFLVTACAHRINITPPLSGIEMAKMPRIEKNVGYYISADDLEKQVITPGGGGDKVKYLPYKESEPVLKAILSNLFFNVYPVSSLNDTQFINSKNISYIFIPEIKTDSSSRSVWIWPPSDFTVTLSCKAIDSSGEMTWKATVNSEAHLGLPAVHKDFSLAGKVAITQAFSKLQDEIHKKFYDQNTDSYYYSPQGDSHNLQEELTDPIDSFDSQDDYSLPLK